MAKKSLNAIGLDKKKAEQLGTALNDLLSNYQVYYMNTRGFHWNIKGDKFFELHAKFEELYNDLQIKIDETAERVLTLGMTPPHTFSQYTKQAQVKEAKNVTGADASIQHIINAFGILLLKQRNILDLSDTAGDEGTNALMSDYIREQYKLISTS